MRFAFTGPAVVDGIHYERQHLIALACEKGHQVQKKVDSNTDYLVKGEVTHKTHKLKEAKSGLHAVGIITPKQFLQKMGFLS